MADSKLRSLERSAQLGDPYACARQLLMRVRTGQLPFERITWAAHLGDPVALLVQDKPFVFVDCGYCRSRRERYRVDQEQGRRREPPPSCIKCCNTARVPLERGLMKFVNRVHDVPLRLVIAWAADCAERGIVRISPRNPNAFMGRYRLPNQPLRDPTYENVIASVRHWFHTGQTDPLIWQNAESNALARAVAQIGIEENRPRLRTQLADLVSGAWDGTRLERSWQEDRLIYYLLGYPD